jgi:hypothetical protein
MYLCRLIRVVRSWRIFNRSSNPFTESTLKSAWLFYRLAETLSVTFGSNQAPRPQEKSPSSPTKGIRLPALGSFLDFAAGAGAGSAGWENARNSASRKSTPQASGLIFTVRIFPPIKAIRVQGSGFRIQGKLSCCSRACLLLRTEY